MVTIIEYYQANEIELRGKGEQPFFRARLARTDAQRLVDRLRELANSKERDWYFLTSSDPDRRRLRLGRDRTPGYELQAAPRYVRGDVITVNGGPHSCNILFSVAGADLLAGRLSAAVDDSDENVEIRVPNRRRKLQLIELLSDRELAAAAEQDILGRSGELLLTEILPGDDFSDWEQSK
jgi:hypothetical protein